MSTSWVMWLSILSFNLAWYLCIAHDEWSLIGLVVGYLAHCSFIYFTSQTWRYNLALDTLWLLFLGALGWAFESCFIFLGVLIQEDYQAGIGAVPYWLLCVWCLFALSFRFALRPLKTWPASLLLPLGSVAAASYFFGAELSSSVQLVEPLWWSLAVIALSWSLLFVCLLKFYWCLQTKVHDFLQ